MGWTFVYLMLGLKIPIFALLYLVWWAIHQTPETEGSGDGGSARPRHPRPTLPRRPRPRGPHGGSSVACPPPRIRRSPAALTVAARHRQLQRH